MPFISSVVAKTSSLSLIRKRSYPKVSGGTLMSDDNNYYRVFTANGDLQVEDLPLNNVKLLIVGGGSGGRWGSTSASWLSDSGGKSVMGGIGGGSGGQVLTPAAIAVPRGTSTVVVGAGGGNNAKGSNSSFQPSGQSTITALGGENHEHTSYTNVYGGNYDSVTGQTFSSRNGYDLWQGKPLPPNVGGNGYAQVQGSSYGGYFPYLPYFMNGGGGAGGHNLDFTGSNIGTGGSGDNANEYSGGTGCGGFTQIGILEFLIVNSGLYGGGAGGSGGGYQGGYSYWGDYYETVNKAVGMSGPGAGWSSTGFYDSPTSGEANRGGGGGSGQVGFGNGGSGIVIVKYPKSEVGG